MSPENNIFSDLNSNYKKTLVAEQPGFILSMVGILLSIFISIVVKATLSSEKVLVLIDKAATKMDRRLDVRVGSASISLADGVFPEVAVVVKDLHISSEESCWMRPQLEVDELKLPLSFFHLLKGEIYIHQIKAGDVGLSLRSSLSNCSQRKPAQAEQSTQLENQAGSLAADISEITSAGGRIDEVSVENLHIHYLPLAFTTFKIKDFFIQLVATQPKKIKSSGLLYLAGETLSGDYSSTAKLNIDYSEEESAKWNFQMSGQWREGHYDLSAEYLPLDQKISTNIDMSHIPMSQLFPLLKKYNLLQSEFNGKQVWLTVKAQAKGNASDLQKLPVQVDLLRVEGDIGEIEARQIQIQSLEPFRYEPILIDIRSLNLDAFLVFLNRAHPSAALGRLGTIHGKAKLDEDGDFNLTGDSSGLEFIFSNRGLRQLQAISLMSGELQFHKNRWFIKIDRIKPVEGVFLGKLSIEADQNWRDIVLKTKIDDLTLGEPVQKLMTGGGEIGPITSDFALSFKDGELKNISGLLTASEINMDQMNIRSSRFQIQSQGELVFIETKLHGISIPTKTAVYQLLVKNLNINKEEDSLIIKSISSKMESHFLKDFWFKNTKIQTNNGILELNGGWNQLGELSGKMILQSAHETNHYELSGHRDHPQITIKK